MEFIFIIIAVIIIFFIIAFLNEPKDNLNKDYSIKDEFRKPLSKETLKNINESREYNYSQEEGDSFVFSKEEITKEILSSCGIKYDDENIAEDFIFTKVAGVSNVNEDGTHRQVILRYCYEGEPLFLERDVHNKYSKYAIKVCRMYNNEQIGYLNDSLAKKLKNREIEKFIVTIKEITGGTEDKPNLGCNIKIIFSA